jgi:N-acetylneuraminic acid mutarotase
VKSRITLTWILALILFAAMVQTQVGQLTHDTWKHRAPLPTAVVEPAAAVLEIYVLGGIDNSGVPIADVQVYNPATNKWSRGVSLPTALDATSAAVIKNVLYVFGGTERSEFG